MQVGDYYVSIDNIAAIQTQPTGEGDKLFAVVHLKHAMEKIPRLQRPGKAYIITTFPNQATFEMWYNELRQMQ